MGRKIGGSDNDRLYAIKAIQNISQAIQLTAVDNIIGEREVMLKIVVNCVSFLMYSLFW